MTSGVAKLGGVDIWYDRIGNPDHPAYLLITGSVGQAVAIDLTFAEILAERGYQVIRFDQRDTGRSTKLPEANYTAGDVADDSAGLLRSLGINEAHVFGISAGGAFAMLLTMRHPSLVRSLVSFMSTHINSRDPKYSTPAHEAAKAFQQTPMQDDEEGKLDRIVTAFRDFYSGRPRFPVNEEYVRRYAKGMIEAENRVGDSPRLVGALMKARPFPDEDLAQIRAPFLAIHGTHDPLVNIRCAFHTVRTIPGGRLMAIDGMGHDMVSPRIFPLLAETMDHHAKTSPPIWLRDGLDAPREGEADYQRF